MAPYLSAIVDIFKREGKDKQHSSWILERVRDHPEFKDRLDLPTDEDVKKVLGRLIGMKKKAKDGQEPDYLTLLQNGRGTHVGNVLGLHGGHDAGQPPQCETSVRVEGDGGEVRWR